MGTDFPLKEKSRFSGMLRLEKIMISVLSGSGNYNSLSVLKDILSHFFDHMSISFKS
jgi:hypothetical protein